MPGASYPTNGWLLAIIAMRGFMGRSIPIAVQRRCLRPCIGIGELLKSGWKPKRTIVFGSWDAEEEGLIGSTEWGEAACA